MAKFRLIKNSAQEKYLKSTSRIQLMGGGFANGKTALTCVKILNIAKDYPGSRGVFARSTRPKLEDTVKPEFFKWCPPDWIEKMPTEKHNDVKLKNGSTIHFRHVRQEGKAKSENTSNLLSATYDWAAVDQIDDPSFTHKDFMDLQGRLRGTTKYVGDDKTMPLVGPQWLLMTCNPTRNWVFRELVNPYHIYKRSGIVTEKLLYNKNARKCILDVYEASTYTNVHNTGQEYVDSLVASYKGSMAQRFLEGKWGAYEGLVYPEFDQVNHVYAESEINDYVEQVIQSGEFGIIEGYDHGIVVPSCYMLGIVDKYQNVYIVDGIYETGVKIPEFSDRIREIRRRRNILPDQPIWADPAIFRATNTSKQLVGEAVSQMYLEEGINMRRGNNNIESGVAKISSHLAIQSLHYNQIRGVFGAPYLYFSAKLEWLVNEIGDYYWNKNIAGDNVDKPRDTNDHAMDTLKYMYSGRPRIGRAHVRTPYTLPQVTNEWTEVQVSRENVRARHLM